MEIDNTKTDTLSATDGELDELSAMLAPDSEMTCNRVEITTANGDRLCITGTLSMPVTIEKNPDTDNEH